MNILCFGGFYNGENKLLVKISFNFFFKFGNHLVSQDLSCKHVSNFGYSPSKLQGMVRYMYQSNKRHCQTSLPSILVEHVSPNRPMLKTQCKSSSTEQPWVDTTRSRPESKLAPVRHELHFSVSLKHVGKTQKGKLSGK